MELSPVTKLLLWLLSKRPEIGNLSVQDLTPMDYLLDPEQPEDNEQLLALCTELSPDQIREFTLSHLNDCYNAPSSGENG